MNVLFAGAGAVGCTYAAQMARAGQNVALLARGAQLAALQKGPLQVRSFLGDFSVDLPVLGSLGRSSSQASTHSEPWDVIFVCVKTYQTAALLPLLHPAVSESTLVIPLQNGVNQHLPLVAAFGETHVARGVTYLGAYLERPGLLRHTASGRIRVAECEGQPRDERISKLCAYLSDAGIEIERSNNMTKTLWEKLVWNIGFNGPTALLDVTVGDLMQRPEQVDLVRELMEEAITVGLAAGVAIDPAIGKRELARASKDFPDVLTSMAFDRRGQRPLEWQPFYGFVAEEGRKVRVETPACDLLRDLLSALSPPTPKHL